MAEPTPGNSNQKPLTLRVKLRVYTSQDEKTLLMQDILDLPLPEDKAHILEENLQKYAFYASRREKQEAFWKRFAHELLFGIGKLEEIITQQFPHYPNPHYALTVLEAPGYKREEDAP